MKTKFNFNSQICTTREQSERLTALGLKKETADMVWHFTHNRSLALQWELNPHPPVTKNNCRLNIDRLNVLGRKKADGTLMTGEEYFNQVWGKDIPAWSLNRLIEMMPFDVFDNCFTLIKNYPSGYGVEYDELSYYHKENIYDTLIEGIEHLIKEGYFNKEYLV